MTANVVTTLAEFSSLRCEWDALAQTTATPLLDHDWCLSCAETLHDERDLRVVTVREHGRLTGVAPMVLEPGRYGRHLTLVGAQRLYEPGGWLYSSPAALAELTDATLALRLPILLHRIPATSGIPTELRSRKHRHALTIVRHASPTYSVLTHGPWDVFRSRMSRRTLSALSNTLAAAEMAHGPSRAEELIPTPADVGHLLQMFANIESSGWKGRKQSSLSQRHDLATFFQQYCTKASEAERLRLTLLYFGSIVAAAEIAVDAYGRRWGLKVAYREDLAEFLPGLNVIDASVKATVKRALESYEFLGSAEDWQRRWRPATRQYLITAAYPLCTSSIVTAGRDLASYVRRLAGKTWANASHPEPP